MKHTPTPYNFNISVNDPDFFSLSSNGIEIGLIDRLLDISPEDEEGNSEGETNAAFIVQACNSHADLLEALKLFVQDVRCHGFGYKLEKAAAAIAKAEGRS